MKIVAYKIKGTEYYVDLYKRKHSFTRLPHIRFNEQIYPHMKFLMSIWWRWHTLSFVAVKDWRKDDEEDN